MIQKAAAIGNWWLAASSWQCANSCITSCVEFFGETSNHPGDSAPLQRISGTMWLLAFLKTKIMFEREEISNHQGDSRKYDRAADGNWENCVRSQSAYFEGDWGIIVLCTVFFVCCIFFNKCIYFSYYMAGYLLGRPCMSPNDYWEFSAKLCHVHKNRKIKNEVTHLKCSFLVDFVSSSTSTLSLFYYTLHKSRVVCLFYYCIPSSKLSI